MHCMLQVTGPDSKGLKSRYNAFHTFRNGRTTLSCSALLILPAQCGQAGHGISTTAGTAASSAGHTAVVLAPVTCLYPFIQSSSGRHKLSGASSDDLIPSVEITVLINPSVLADQHSSSRPPSSNSAQNAQAPAIVQVPAKLNTVLQLPVVHAAAEQLLLSTNAAAAAGDWKFGWCLADQQPLAAATPAILGHVAVLTVDICPVLQAPSAQPIQRVPGLLSRPGSETGNKASQQGHQTASSCCCSSSSSSSSSTLSGVSSAVRTASSSTVQRCAAVYQGQTVTVTGSPFGCLAEQQFFGAVVSGCVSLLLPTTAPSAAAAAPGLGSTAAAAAEVPLFLIDGRCMPGMEGGPVHCRSCGALIGVLGVPLSNCSSQAELLLGISTQHITAALAAASRTDGGAQLKSVAAALEAASCCCCCSRFNDGSSSSGGTAGSAAGESSSSSNNNSCSGSGSGSSSSSGSGSSSSSSSGSGSSSSSSSSSSSRSCLQVSPAAAHDTLWQQPAQLVTKPQQQQQQASTLQEGEHLQQLHLNNPTTQHQPKLQQRRWSAQDVQLRAASSSSSSSSSSCSRQAAGAVDHVRRLHVHLQHLTPAVAAAGPTDQHIVPQQAFAAHTQTAAGATVAAGSSSSSSNSGKTGWPGLLPSASSGVVMVRVGRSWGSGVLITQSGLVLTVAHLFRKGNSSRQAASAAAAAAADYPRTPAPELRQGAGSYHMHSSSSSGGGNGSSGSSSSGVLRVQQQDANSRRTGQQRLYPIPPQHLQDPPAPEVSIRLTLPGTAATCSSSSSSSGTTVGSTSAWGGGFSSSSSSRNVWVPAKVLYCFTGYLDLAVLQIQPDSLKGIPAPSLLQPLQLVPPKCDVTPGDEVFVIGHGLFGPRMGLDPAVTAGCVAKVVAVPPTSTSSSSGMKQQQQQQWKPSMVVSTAAVHSGASGGALVDAAGRLVGLVTSNARHVKGQTLPHLNFCISAAELRPVWDWAQQQQHGRGVLLQVGPGEQQGSDVLSRPVKQQQQQQRELAMLDVHSVAGSKLWALQPYMHAAAAVKAPPRVAAGLVSSL